MLSPTLLRSVLRCPSVNCVPAASSEGFTLWNWHARVRRSSLTPPSPWPFNCRRRIIVPHRQPGIRLLVHLRCSPPADPTIGTRLSHAIDARRISPLPLQSKWWRGHGQPSPFLVILHHSSSCSSAHHQHRQRYTYTCTTATQTHAHTTTTPR